MRCSASIATPLIAVSLLVAGCTQNPFVAAPTAPGQNAPYLAQMRDLDRRAADLDTDNRDLHTEVARIQQEKQLLTEQVVLLQKRLKETSNELQQAQRVSSEVQQQMRTIEASTRRRGGATITANNSLKDALEVPDVPGFEVRQDKDVIRIDIPSDRLFHPQSSQLLPTATYLLDDLADAMIRHFPDQMIGVEAHTDNSPSGNTSHHQLAASQAVSVLMSLTRRNRILPYQIFTAGHGANHPRVSNATPAGRSKNRRIELVIYPDKVRGRS
ncbi:MAG: OmpA family protein [Pirellulaceae bacterium]